MRVAAAALVAVLALPALASAQDDGFWIERSEMARLAGEAAEARELAAKVRLLEERLAIEAARTAALRDLLDLERQKAALQADVAKIQETRAEQWRARVEEVRQEASAEARRARVLAGCATGAALGSFAPPFGPLVGAGIGCAAGFFLP